MGDAGFCPSTVPNPRTRTLQNPKDQRRVTLTWARRTRARAVLLPLASCKQRGARRVFAVKRVESLGLKVLGSQSLKPQTEIQILDPKPPKLGILNP